MRWNPDSLGSLDGSTYVITGGNSGIGLQAARILCGKGARVVITARSTSKAEGAEEEVRAAVPEARIEHVLLDLTDPDSIQAAVAAIEERCEKLDALINNAGVMQTPERKTAEGFELQLATNHLGHFRLTRGLYPLLRRSEGRVAVVSSIVHRSGSINLDDLMLAKAYDPTRAYSQSKLANIMFAFELQRRLQAVDSPVVCIPCHPGYSATNLQTAGVGMEGGSTFFKALYAVTNRVVAQSAEHGSWPLVLAAADPEAEGGVYYGPTWAGDMFGPVGRSTVGRQARDEGVARKLWEATEALVGAFELT